MELSINQTAAVALNTRALGIEANLSLILSAADKAQAAGCNALFAGELSVCGAECAQMFGSTEFDDAVQQALKQFTARIPEGMTIGLGISSKREPCYLILRRGQTVARISGHMAAGGQASACTDVISRQLDCSAVSVSASDLIKAGTVTLAEGSILVLPGCALGTDDRRQQLIAAVKSSGIAYRYMVMPSLHAFEFPDEYQGQQQAREFSEQSGIPVVVINNLGCEGGALLYDGYCAFYEHGKTIAANTPFSFAPFSLVTAVSTPAGTAGAASAAAYGAAAGLGQFELETRAVALGLRDWMNKTWSKGYALSLSGGADSALCAACCALAQLYTLLDCGLEDYCAGLKQLGIKFDEAAFREAVVAVSADRFTGPWHQGNTDQKTFDGLWQAVRQYVMPQVLWCAYQASDYSGSVTRTAAREMAQSAGATFYEWSVAPVVHDYVANISQALGYDLTWEHDDIALQNIQARSRLPGIWLLANHRGLLLMATSNLSEATVGYCTMDGDTAGGLSPIAGIDKTTILRINRHIATDGIAVFGEHCPVRWHLEGMKFIVAQEPTAELRPGGEQTDEKDLMPYPLLDELRRRFLAGALPETLVTGVMADLKAQKIFNDQPQIQNLTEEQLRLFVQRFVRLFQRSQWKRERFATGFHIQRDDVSPKSGMEFPILGSDLMHLQQ